MTLPKRMTYAEYRSLPDDGQRYELLEGELFVTPAPSLRHQRLSMSLCVILGSFIRAERLGSLYAAPTDVKFEAETSLQPDLLFISQARGALLESDGDAVQGAPDLVIEILSPSNPKYDREKKRQGYSRCGVREYWIVDPTAEVVEVLTQQGEGLENWQSFAKGELLTSPVLPGVRLDLAAVFDD